MANIIKKIEAIEGLYKANAACNEDIVNAEKKLGLDFPKEYKDYLKNFGAISFYATELNGLNVPAYVNVIESTLEERENNSLFPRDVFVVENIRIDGILAISDEEGQIYLWKNGSKKKIADTFYDYIQMCIERKEK